MSAPVLTTAQRTQIGTEQFGHHVDPVVGEVDGRAAVGRFAVDGTSGSDEVRHVSDVHAHLQVAVRQTKGVQRVVDVGAAGRVDAADADVAQIHSLLFVLQREVNAKMYM